jgi:hypothetical protein
MSTLKVTTLQNLSGTEVYTAKAWVNFNGNGTVAIRSSGNVSSITDNGTGTYTVNFTVAMPNANYAIAGTTVGEPTIWANYITGNGTAPTTTTCRIITQQGGTTYDSVASLVFFSS